MLQQYGPVDLQPPTSIEDDGLFKLKEKTWLREHRWNIFCHPWFQGQPLQDVFVISNEAWGIWTRCTYLAL